jgi:hypothetical protein
MAAATTSNSSSSYERKNCAGGRVWLERYVFAKYTMNAAGRQLLLEDLSKPQVENGSGGRIEIANADLDVLLSRWPSIVGAYCSIGATLASTAAAATTTVVEMCAMAETAAEATATAKAAFSGGSEWTLLPPGIHARRAPIRPGQAISGLQALGWVVVRLSSDTMPCNTMTFDRERSTVLEDERGYETQVDVSSGATVRLESADGVKRLGWMLGMMREQDAVLFPNRRQMMHF